MYFREWSGTTRSSWSAVNSSNAGYCAPLSGILILCKGEYLKINQLISQLILQPANQWFDKQQMIIIGNKQFFLSRLIFSVPRTYHSVDRMQTWEQF